MNRFASQTDERSAWHLAEQKRLAEETGQAIIDNPFTVARMIIDGCGTRAEAKETANDIIEWATGVRVQDD